MALSFRFNLIMNLIIGLDATRNYVIISVNPTQVVYGSPNLVSDRNILNAVTCNVEGK